MAGGYPNDHDPHPQREIFVREKVAAGPYAPADKVIEEALILLDEWDRLQLLRAASAEGEQGPGILFTPELLEEISREVDERVRPPSPDVCP